MITIQLKQREPLGHWALTYNHSAIFLTLFDERVAFSLVLGFPANALKTALCLLSRSEMLICPSIISLNKLFSLDTHLTCFCVAVSQHRGVIIN